MSWWVLLLLGWGLAATLQLVLYGVQVRTGSATVVDAGWAASLAGIAILYAALGGGERCIACSSRSWRRSPSAG
jgi:steroid 5-alpha reductase family enzyme